MNDEKKPVNLDKNSPVNLSKGSPVNLNKEPSANSSTTPNTNVGNPPAAAPAPKKHIVRNIGCGFFAFFMLTGIIASMANCLGCFGKSDPNSNSESSSFTGSPSGSSSEPSYNASDVVNTANVLFNAIKNADTPTSRRYIINDERLQKLSVLYSPENFLQNNGQSNDYMSVELIKLCSDFQYSVGTPLIDEKTGTASVDIRFDVPDLDQIVSRTKLYLEVMLTNSGNALSQSKAAELLLQVMSYIATEYGVTTPGMYPQEERFNFLFAGTVHCCKESGMYNNIPNVTKIHTFTFTYMDGVWKLSGCDDLASFSMTLAGDADPSLYSGEDISISTPESSVPETSIPEASIPETSVPESAIYNENDVVGAANTLFTLIKNGEAEEGLKYIIDDVELGKILVLFTPEFRRSTSYAVSELIGICSEYQIYVGKPRIDQSTGTANVEIEFSVPDFDSILAKTQLLATDILTGSCNVLNTYETTELNYQISDYIKNIYNVSLTEHYSEEVTTDLILGATLGCCYKRGYYNDIAFVKKTHTLTFIYQDGGWKLSECDDPNELIITLMGDMDSSLYS